MSENRTVSVGEWIITYLIMCIPLVNLIMLFVWAFGSGTKPSKVNWAKASLIFVAISIVLGIIFSSVFAGIFSNMFKF